MFCGLTSNVLAMDKLAAPWCLGSNLMNSLAVSCVACVGFCQCTTNPCHGVGQRRRITNNNTSGVHSTSQKPFTAEADRYSVYLRYLFTWV